MPQPRPSPRRPRRIRHWILGGTAAAGVLAAGAIAFVYFVLFSHSAPATLSLGTSATAVPTPALTAAQIPGSWSVGSGSLAGYRVREQLAFLQAPDDAVGRTSSITGGATIVKAQSGFTVTAASFSVDVSTLASDQQMRDQRIQEIGLQSATFPHASFLLTSPVALPAAAASGQLVHVSAAGRLTIHGVTRIETIPLEAQLTGSHIDITGSITFPWGDFGMEAPSVGGFVSVTGQATMEFSLVLQRA
jgi:polyisoprenoid-binding protein YceI